MKKESIVYLVTSDRLRYESTAFSTAKKALDSFLDEFGEDLNGWGSSRGRMFEAIEKEWLTHGSGCFAVTVNGERKYLMALNVQ